MILRFRHRGLERLYNRGERRGLNPQHVDKIERILARLDAATQPSDLDIPGFRLHALKSNMAGFWSITVQANWRIVFRFADGDVTGVDYVDYH